MWGGGIETSDRRTSSNRQQSAQNALTREMKEESSAQTIEKSKHITTIRTKSQLHEVFCILPNFKRNKLEINKKEISGIMLYQLEDKNIKWYWKSATTGHIRKLLRKQPRMDYFANKALIHFRANNSRNKYKPISSTTAVDNQIRKKRKHELKNLL